MPDFRSTLRTLAAELESSTESRRLRTTRPARVVISPYRGFGRGHELFLRGRLLAEKPITRARERETVWRNLLNAYRRFQSDELPGVAVRTRYRDAWMETVTDDEGYFQVRLEPKEIDPGVLWHEVDLEAPAFNAVARGHVLSPSPAARFAVISDIDDTIVQTGATKLLTMIRSVAMENARTRLPFEGVSELYRRLYADRNPIFYVSSSPWNLYELLHDFMDIHGLPPGPMFLQDFGVDDQKLIHAEHDVHKLAEIARLIEYYHGLPFVLFGDSGQRDPEIYLQAIQAHPGRVRAAFIRDVTHDVRDKAVTAIVESAKAAGVEMLYIRDSNEAATHAERLGLFDDVA
jgi:phosphatidate phosphatase APP1